MTKDSTFDYEALVQESLRHVIREALSVVGRTGLPGKHHFYISFKTDYPGVDLPTYLREEYPDDITIVLQHEFWDLEVNGDAFSVTLCFNDVHERLNIPFGAVVSFVDPSVKFGLQFTPAEPEEAITPIPMGEARKSTESLPNSSVSDGSNVIALDAFRRK